MLEEQVSRLKEQQRMAKQELASIEFGVEDEPEQQKGARTASANNQIRANRNDKTNEEEQDKLKITELLKQLDQNNEEIY